MELKQFYIFINTKRRSLLIVPYGIETSADSASINLQDLLIVPYGIETCVPCGLIIWILSFNRTLWN